MTEEKTTFGMHLMLDAYEANPKKLDDMKLIFKFLNTLVKKIGMSQLTAPIVIDCDETETGKDPGGISGFVVIAESHISIHTFPKRGFFTMDLYSCREFKKDLEMVLAYTKECFEYKREELNIVQRGSFYPHQDIHQ